MSSTLTQESSRHEYNIDEAIAEIGIGRYHYKRYVWLGGVAFSIAASLSLSFIIMIKYVCMASQHIFLGFWIMSLVFTGFVLGSFTAGILCDKIGRQPVMIFGMWLMAINTVLMALTINSPLDLYPWHIFLGLGLGLTEFTYIIVIAEFSTRDTRALAIVLSGVFYGLGGVFVSVITYLTINSTGWRSTILICSIPIIINAIGVTFISETPKYYSASDQRHRAMTLLKEIASENGTDVPRGTLNVTPIEDRGNLLEVFGPFHMKHTVLLMVLFFLTGFVFYSVWGMLPFVLQSGTCGLPNRHPSTLCSFSGLTLVEAIIITSSQLAFLPLVTFVSNVFGRLPAIQGVASTMFVSALCTNFCFRPYFFIAALFVLRGSSQSLVNLLVIYTPEVYPTHIRAVSFAFVMALSVVGGLVSSTVVWSIGYDISWEMMLVTITVFSGVICTISCLLDLETYHLNLADGRDFHEWPSSNSNIFSNKSH